MALACAPAAGASGAGPRSLRASIIRGPALPCIDRRRTWRPGVSRRAQAQVEVALPPIEVEHADVVTGPLGDAPEPRRRRGLLAVTCILGGYVVGMVSTGSVAHQVSLQQRTRLLFASRPSSLSDVGGGRERFGRNSPLRTPWSAEPRRVRDESPTLRILSKSQLVPPRP